MKETVESLRKKGYKVRVNHYRVDKRDVKSYGSKNIGKNLIKGSYEGGKSYFIDRPENIYPKGGITEVVLDDIIKGEAVCSIKDVYNKRLGVRIALNRIQNKIKKDYKEAMGKS